MTVTGNAPGCPHPVYEFWMRTQTSSSWQLVQGYSTSPTYRWNTSGAPAGTVYFGVWAKDAQSTAAYDANSSAPYGVFSPCASLSVSFSPPPPLAHGSGTPVTVTGSASGCSHPVYEFWMRTQTSSSWQLVQGYSTSPAYRWNTSGAPAGTVYFGVWAKDAQSTAAHDANSSAPYRLT